MVLKHLPVWDAPLTGVITGNSSEPTYVSTESAAKGLIIPSTERFFPTLTPEKFRSFIREEEEIQNIVAALGARRLSPGEYAYVYIIPYLPERADATMLPIIKEFLESLLAQPNVYFNPKFRKARVIPDRTGTLRRGLELYDEMNQIFASSFQGDDTAFPHPLVSKLSLSRFGLNQLITKSILERCARRLEQDYLDGNDQNDVWERCRTVWNAFALRRIRIEHPQWTYKEVRDFAQIQFVPVYRPGTDSSSYRNDLLRERVGNKSIATMEQIVHSKFFSIAWTQRPIAGTTLCDFTDVITFVPDTFDVVEHLVELATTIAAKCLMSDECFYKDLDDTYKYLSRPTILSTASNYLRDKHNDKKIWLNEDISLEDLSKSSKERYQSTIVHPVSLNWLSAGSILHGVPYDVPSAKLYAAKASIERYGNLLRACGSHVVETINAIPHTECVENHGNNVLKHIREMLQTSDSMCDMKIIVGGKEYSAHRVLLGAVSSYFRVLACGTWKENSSGVIIFDASEVSESVEQATGILNQFSVTSSCVQSVLEWVYNGFLFLDDGNLEDDDNVKDRLDHYLDLLHISDMWDIPELRTHVENRILTRSTLFIRIENVADVLKIANEYNSTGLKGFCEDYLEKNRGLVELVEASALL